jgi:hypothetical protein
MGDRKQLEARLLSAAELEDVNATRPAAIEQASDEQLKVLAQRLRRSRNRAKDIAAGQKREMRGIADPRRTKPTRDNTGTLAKAQVLGQAIERIEEELSRRENLTTATTTQADLSRHALELKLSHPAPPHPGSGRSASEGMKSKERQKPLRVGPSKGEVGRVSQEGKVAQARKDSRDR